MKKLFRYIIIPIFLLILVSCQKDVKYEVSFDLNGGVGNFPAQFVIKGETATKPNEEPTKEDYEFNDWYLGEEPFSFNTKITSDLVLIAKWDLIEVDVYYTVTFNSDGGSYVASQSVLEQTTLILLDDPIKEGYNFLGWYLDEQLFDFETKITSNLTLVAKWELEVNENDHIITFVLNNGEDDVTYIIDSNEKILPLNDISKDNHIFLGWYSDLENDIKWDFDEIVTRNLTLEARWAEIKSERTKIGAIRAQVQDSPTFNNAADLQIEPSYFFVQGHKSGNNRPGIYDELRFYTGTAMTFTIHESFIIYEIVISNNDDKFTVSSNGVNLSSLTNLNIQSFKITNPTSGRLDTDYIEIHYYQVGADVVKEDDINRPVFDLGEDNLYEKEIGQTFEAPVLSANDVEDGDIVASIDNTKSTFPNPNAKGIYYIHYYAEDNDGYIGTVYITIIYREVKALDNYYGNALDKPNNQLESSLKSLLKTTLDEVTYAKAKDVLEISDRDPNNFDNVWLIYNSATIIGKWQSPNYAREHVWAKSAFGGNHSITAEYDGYGVKFVESYKGAASDLHNLRAINPSVNSSHSNYEFGDNNGLVTGEWQLLSLSSRPHNPYTPGKENDMTTNVFYPGNKHKGDVARIIFYMMLVWDLTPREDINMLVQWHLDDPVDNFEIIRNEVIFSYQGNRNPFIDYPDLVTKTFIN